MMNNLYFQLDGDKSAFVRLVSKISRIMKLTLFLVCLSISMSFAMTTNAQSTSLSFKATDQSIKEVLELIESQTDFHFFYNSKLVDINQVISVDIKDKDVFTTLDHIFENSNIRYKIVGKDVILSVKGSKSDQNEKTVTGTVVDETGEPIIGANIVEKGKANGTMSDLNGHFSIVVSSDAVLQISYIGFSILDFKVKLNILPTLNTELSLARQSQEYFKRIYVNSNHKESIDNMRSGRGTLQEENYTDYTLEWIGNYFTTIDKHTIKLMAGYSYQEFNHRSFSSENANFPSDAMSYNNLEAGDWNMAAGRLGVSSLKEKEKTIGFPARLIYNYDDTYYLTASVRYEGNSKFGANHKWGWFPAASAAWRMSSLPAIKNIEAINDLKLRFSYGVTGRSGFPKYSALARYEQGGYWLDDNGQWTQAWGPTNNPNPDLHWEKQISYNLGVDFSLLKNKLSGSLDAYVKQGKEVISNYDAPLPPFMFDQIFTNVASTSSKGLELTLNWDVVNMKDFSYSTNLVASFTKSKLDKFSNGTYQKGYMDRYLLPAPGNPGYAQRLQDGVEIGSFYGLRYAGVDDNGNMLVWKDAKIGGEKILANGEASDTDKDYIGHGTPRYSLSWGNTFRYKGFDLSLYFQGRFDYQILNMYQMYYGLVAEPGMNLLEDAYGKNGHIKSGKVMCDYFLEDGDYFRLDNITLGWTPKLDTKWISNLRVYATVKNAFTITKYSVMDPTSVDINGLEPGISGLNVYPIARSFTFGIQISY